MTDLVRMEMAYPLPDGAARRDDDPQGSLACALASLLKLDKQLPSIGLVFP
jgi:hypothetical protein